MTEQQLDRYTCSNHFWLAVHHCLFIVFYGWLEDESTMVVRRSSCAVCPILFLLERLGIRGMAYILPVFLAGAALAIYKQKTWMAAILSLPAFMISLWTAILVISQ